MSQSLVDRVKEKVRYHLVLQALFGTLARVGIKVVPYYVTRECLNTETKPALDPQMGEVVTALLSPEEIEAVYIHPDSRVMGDVKAKYLDERCLCFGLRVNGETAAYMWCNLHRCHSELTKFALKDDEAYLCSMVTFKAFRGKNLAPFLRYEVYRHLNRTGRTNYYSITELFNTSALKFKEKLGARQLRLGLHIGLFNRLHWSITLKNYRV